MNDELVRIEAACRWAEDETSTRIAPWRFGSVLLNDAFPTRYDSNFLRVERSLAAATAQDLAAEADVLLGAFGHREIVVPDEIEGERLAPGFAELGWQTDRLVYQVRRRDPDRIAPVRAQEVTIDQMMVFREETWRRAYGESSVSLAAFGRVAADRLGARFFVAEVDGVMAAGCELYVHDGVAQVEEVNTLEEHRGRGLARSVVLAAADAALEAGVDLMFLIADDADWPKALYAKLGFDELGRFWQFTLPARSAGASEAGPGRSGSIQSR